MATRRCAIYARISVSQEASVSIDRQVEAAEQYAAARGWQVVGTFVDDGVSATHNKPEQRSGWRALLDSPASFDAVIVWKVDRLARRALDFLQAHEALRERKAGIVAVEDPLDMTTAQGRAFATLLAVFAEMEAEAIRARVKAARDHLVHAGRVVGGARPYGWMSVPNPDGPGLVLVQDPDRIGYVRGMVERAQRGDTIYSIKQWLDETGVPIPTASQNGRKRQGWAYTTVESLLRNPVLAGLTVYNPGNQTKRRGDEVLRDANGLPVVDESIAIMTAGEWRAMVKALDNRDSAQSMPRAMRAKTSALLSGLIWCAEHPDEPVRMYRGTTAGRATYNCPKCHMTISHLDEIVVEEFLLQKGERVRWSRVEEVHEGGAAVLPEIEQRLAELTAQLGATDDDAEAGRLTEQITNLRAIRREARSKPSEVVLREVRGTQHFAEDWAQAESVHDKRAVLDDAIERVWVRRGRPGRRAREHTRARLTFDWKMPDEVGPLPTPTDEDMATLRPWEDAPATKRKTKTRG